MNDWDGCLGHYQMDQLEFAFHQASLCWGPIGHFEGLMAVRLVVMAH
jgi:hypothetical protein